MRSLHTTTTESLHAATKTQHGKKKKKKEILHLHQIFSLHPCVNRNLHFPPEDSLLCSPHRLRVVMLSQPRGLSNRGGGGCVSSQLPWNSCHLPHFLELCCTNFLNTTHAPNHWRFIIPRIYPLIQELVLSHLVQSIAPTCRVLW